jgi:hypothetical protein
VFLTTGFDGVAEGVAQKQRTHGGITACCNNTSPSTLCRTLGMRAAVAARRHKIGIGSAVLWGREEEVGAVHGKGARPTATMAGRCGVEQIPARSRPWSRGLDNHGREGRAAAFQGSKRQGVSSGLSYGAGRALLGGLGWGSSTVGFFWAPWLPAAESRELAGRNTSGALRREGRKDLRPWTGRFAGAPWTTARRMSPGNGSCCSTPWTWSSAALGGAPARSREEDRNRELAPRGQEGRSAASHPSKASNSREQGGRRPPWLGAGREIGVRASRHGREGTGAWTPWIQGGSSLRAAVWKKGAGKKKMAARGVDE